MIGWGAVAIWMGAVVYVLIKGIIQHIIASVTLDEKQRGFDVFPPKDDDQHSAR